MSIGNDSAQPNERGGCANIGCFGGCMIIGGLLLVLGLCGGGGLYFWASSQIQKYTAEDPVELPTVELPPAQLAELETRLKSFKQAVEKKNEDQGDLVLTADEINAMIAKNKETRGKLYVNIKDGQVGGDVSIPTDKIPGGKGRFFNGSVTLDVSMEQGVLIVTLSDAKVNGERVPQAFIDAVGKENLAKDMYKDPESAKMMRRFDSISVEDDKIILKLRKETTSSEPVATEDDETVNESATESNQDQAAPASKDQ